MVPVHSWPKTAGGSIFGVANPCTSVPHTPQERIFTITWPAAGSGMTAPSTTSAATTAAFTRFRDPSGVILEHPRTWTVESSAGTDPLVVYLDPATGVPFRRNVNSMSQSGPRL